VRDRPPPDCSSSSNAEAARRHESGYLATRDQPLAPPSAVLRRAGSWRPAARAMGPHRARAESVHGDGHGSQIASTKAWSGYRARLGSSRTASSGALALGAVAFHARRASDRPLLVVRGSAATRRCAGRSASKRWRVTEAPPLVGAQPSGSRPAVPDRALPRNRPCVGCNSAGLGAYHGDGTNRPGRPSPAACRCAPRLPRRAPQRTGDRKAGWWFPASPWLAYELGHCWHRRAHRAPPLPQTALVTRGRGVGDHVCPT
jgi:hypothetical protein